MADWCLSRRNYEILEEIFKEKPPDLFWDNEIQPLFKALWTQLDGNKIPEDNYEPKRLKLDSGTEILICQGGLIVSTVVRTKIKIVLETAGVKPLPPPTGWARLRVAFSLRRCNH